MNRVTWDSYKLQRDSAFDVTSPGVLTSDPFLPGPFTRPHFTPLTQGREQPPPLFYILSTISDPVSLIVCPDFTYAEMMVRRA